VARKTEEMRKPKEFKKFEDLLRQVLAVPKTELDRREAEYKAKRKTQKPLTRKGK
jgi:hypothetical protein